MTPVPAAPEAPTPLALAGTPYVPEVIQAVTEEIASETNAVKPRAVRVKSRPSSQRATKGGAHKAAKPAAKKPVRDRRVRSPHPSGLHCCRQGNHPFGSLSIRPAIAGPLPSLPREMQQESKRLRAPFEP